MIPLRILHTLDLGESDELTSERVRAKYHLTVKVSLFQIPHFVSWYRVKLSRGLRLIDEN